MSASPRRAACRAGAVLLLALLASTAPGQTPAAKPPVPASVEWLTRLAADDRTLWLFRVTPQESLPFRRELSGAFVPLAPLLAPVDAVRVTGRGLFAFTDRSELYSWLDDGWSRARDLPQRVQPFDVIAAQEGLYALIPSTAAAELPGLLETATGPATRPFDPGNAAFTVVRLVRREWVAVGAAPAELPAESPPRLGPRLAVVRGALHVFWWQPDRRDLCAAAWDPATSAWLARTTCCHDPNLSAFWPINVGGVPALVLAERANVGEELRALRLTADPEAAERWRSAELQLSTLPPGIVAARYEQAAGFNQHVALLVCAPDGATYVRFGGLEANPAEPTVRVADVFARALRRAHSEWLRTLTLISPLLIVVALLILRRGALVTPLKLPAEVAPALSLQRMLSFAIDTLPFAAVAALVLNVDSQVALRELMAWAAGTDAATSRLPAMKTLLWWGATCTGQFVYSLVCELVTNRTVGKALTGTRIFSENGGEPTRLQIVARNLLRAIELMPPLWILAFLVVLSRNRQRLGDLVARTVVVRRAPAPPPPEE